jgi:hypothetical protein
VRHALTIHPKVTGATLGVAMTTIVLWVLSYWVSVPDDVKGSMTIIFALVGGWLAPPDKPSNGSG